MDKIFRNSVVSLCSTHISEDILKLLKEMKDFIEKHNFPIDSNGFFKGTLIVSLDFKPKEVNSYDD